jgi:hypothetical protein
MAPPMSEPSGTPRMSYFRAVGMEVGRPTPLPEGLRAAIQRFEGSER